ncbi:MAG: hypothetical protein HOC71_05105 [Candidatus Latescibacteria bacterium]|jgi:hypothetical protein|nr:hypothetical protein [Candidatus Latescibacterota bacterium]
MDKIIFGDNQFFGINHMSEEKAQSQAERFKDINDIIAVIDTVYECGVRAFMFNTHDRVADICDHFRANAHKYPDIKFYPSLPYAHKYASAVTEKGMIGALNEFLFGRRSVGQALTTLVRGTKTIVSRDLSEVMKLLVDSEMRMFNGLNVRAVFLQNIVTDLLLGLGSKEVFIQFAKHIREKYNADPAFNTMNMPRLVDFLIECGIENPIVCSSINKIGYLMNPDKASYENTIRTKPFRPMAMSILASGAISPINAVEYISSLGKVSSIVFGASSRAHIEETIELINAYLP